MKSDNSARNMVWLFEILLTIAFIVLKLCHVIEWAWVWVLAPLWIPLVLGILIAIGIWVWMSL